MLDFTEMNKLYKMCKEAGMNIRMGGVHDGRKIELFDNMGNDLLDDAVIHGFSYGHEIGLLETYELNDCEGYETAELIFEGWKKMVEDYHQKNKNQ